MSSIPYRFVCETCRWQFEGSTRTYEIKDGEMVTIHQEPSGPCEENIADYTVGEDGLMTFHPRPKINNSQARGVEQ